MKLACAAVVALASFASFASDPAAQESTTARQPQDVVVIGTLGGPTSQLVAVNARGQAVGSSDVTTVNDAHAILWEDGRVVDLGVLPGDTSSFAAGINDRGQIVGSSTDLNHGTERAVLWQDGQMIPISPPGVNCNASDINHHGVIAGTCESKVPVVWRDGEMVSIDVPGAFQAFANAINDKGVVVGAALDFQLVQSGFLWQDGRVIELVDGAVTMTGLDINDRGQVVGQSPADGSRPVEPVIWEDGRIRPLSGTWGSFLGTALGINDRGEVVVFGNDASGRPIAFVWADGVFRPLPGLSAIPFDISKHGVAAGSVGDFNIRRGVIWPKAVTRP